MSTCSSCRNLDRGVCSMPEAPGGGCQRNTPACKDYRYIERTEKEVNRLFAAPDEMTEDVSASGSQPEGTLIELEKFSDRAIKAIEALEVTTYEELAGTPDDVIDAVPGIGKATIQEICDKLVELGFLGVPE